MRDGTRHPLYRTVRAALLLLSLAGLVLGVRHLAATVEEVRHAGALRLPEDEAAFRETLVGAFVVAAATFDFDGGIAEALRDGDFDRAAALHRIARSVNMSVSPAVEADYAEATSLPAVAGRGLVDFARGSITGHADGAAGLAGAIGTDLVVPLFGDLRDAGVQLWRHARGQEVDGFILGLAAVGLAVPVAQAATDPLKAALRMRRAKPALVTRLRGLDGPALRAAGSDIAGIMASGGRRATATALRTAETAEDLTVFRRIARIFGAESDGYITLVGRRTGTMYRSWRLTAPLALKLLALGSLVSMAGALLMASLWHATGSRLARIVGLRWLARALSGA
ncbi:MAG TPA: hypothetical protein PKA13_05020 [Geminicoccaceae bacterium]|nr:hypothetical protein [Geminicoccus sp.]HMU49113.1 hypothetical protein [Geminicoccaceae bacterium]